MNYTKEYFDFDLDRKNTRSMKWDDCNSKFGVDESTAMIPMWIADMDFRSPKEVIDAVIDRASLGCYGYTTKPDCFYETIINWVDRRYHWKIKKEWIIFTPGVIPGYTITIQNFTKPGDGIIVQTPVYYPFMDGVVNNGRKLVYNPLIEKEGDWFMDFEDLERKVKDPDNKLLILSNPHNPVGRVWTKEELEKIADICLNNGIIILSDEIHEDLTMPGYTHYPIAVLSEVIGDITVTCTAPSKSFNIAGLQGSNIIIKNKELRAKFIAQQEKKGFFTLNTLSFEATRLAYTKGDAWLAEFKTLIHHNYDILVDFIKKNFPSVTVYPLEGTYLAWLDFRNLGYDYLELEKKMIAADLYLDEGYVFGQEGEGFERINIACPTWVLKEALERLKNAFSGPQVSK